MDRQQCHYEIIVQFQEELLESIRRHPVGMQGNLEFQNFNLKNCLVYNLLSLADEFKTNLFFDGCRDRSQDTSREGRSIIKKTGPTFLERGDKGKIVQPNNCFGVNCLIKSAWFCINRLKNS